jgi:hypothetical protein
MAIEYSLSTDAHPSDDELHAFFAAVLDGAIGEGGTVFRDGMYVTVYGLADGEDDETSHHFGFDEQVSGTFHFSNLAGPETYRNNIARMVSSMLAFSANYPGNGVLLHNGELAVMQWSPTEVVFNSEWEPWSESAEVKALLTGHTVRSMAQPLL